MALEIDSDIILANIRFHSEWVVYGVVSSLIPITVSSSMSERTHLTGHLVLATLVSLFIFPISAHWIWHEEGWLAVRGCTDLGKYFSCQLLSIQS